MPSGELQAAVAVIGAGPAGLAAARAAAAVPRARRRGRGGREAADPADRVILIDAAPAGRGGWNAHLALTALTRAAASGADWVTAYERVRDARRDAVARHEAALRELAASQPAAPDGEVPGSTAATSRPVAVLAGRARLLGQGRIAVDPLGAWQGAGTQVVVASRIVLATGSVPVPPTTSGLGETEHVTVANVETLLERDPPPSSAAVLGAGPTGCAVAQALARLGVTVSLVEARPRILPGEDPAGAALVLTALRRDGVRVVMGSPVVTVAPTLDGGAWVGARDGDVAAEALVLATGNQPATSGLDLAAAGVAVTPSGAVRVDGTTATSGSGVYAAGSVTGRPRHTGLAAAMGAAAGARAAGGPGAALAAVGTWSTGGIVRVVLTEPQLAHAGLPGAVDPSDDQVADGTATLAEVSGAGGADVGGADVGWVRVTVGPAGDGGIEAERARPGRRWWPGSRNRGARTGRDDGRLLAATVVGSDAADRIAPLALAIAADVPVSRLRQALGPETPWWAACRLAMARARPRDR